MLFLRRSQRWFHPISQQTYQKCHCYSTSSKATLIKDKIKQGPGLKEFIVGSSEPVLTERPHIPYLPDNIQDTSKRKIFFDVYGCQMNLNDTDIVWSILKKEGFEKTEVEEEADIFLVMTCAIREGAETKIWHRLDHLRGFKRRRAQSRVNHTPVKIGLLGCMAERLKEKLIEKEKAVDVVAGPDSYRDLPRLLALTESGQTAVNVLLSLDETYADVVPVRLNQDTVSAFISIMRGCDNMCTYCIVPFTRGRERSRPVTSIVDEVRHLADQGVKEVTLLGQNVNSYRDVSRQTERTDTQLAKVDFYDIHGKTCGLILLCRGPHGLVDEVRHLADKGVKEVTLLGQNVNRYRNVSQQTERTDTQLAKGFKTVYKNKKGGLRFADLLDEVSAVDPEMRIRFTAAHPKDFPDEVLRVVSERPNICKMLHLPAQSGCSAVLERMRRGYSREAYLDLVEHVCRTIPGVGLSTDMICGFCSETEEEFQETLSLMEIVDYNVAFLFPYSMREKTTAYRRYKDDVPDHVKKDRHNRMLELYRRKCQLLNEKEIGNTHLVLVEGIVKKTGQIYGRNELYLKVVFDKMAVRDQDGGESAPKPGDYVSVKIVGAKSSVLSGVPLYHSSIKEFYRERSWGERAVNL